MKTTIYNTNTDRVEAEFYNDSEVIAFGQRHLEEYLYGDKFESAGDVLNCLTSLDMDLIIEFSELNK